MTSTEDFTSESDYSVELTGEQWHSANGSEAADIRVWRADGILVIAAQYRGEPGVRGVYDLTSSDLNLEGMTDEFREGWRTWRAALSALADAMYAGTPRRDALLLAIRNA